MPSLRKQYVALAPDVYFVPTIVGKFVVTETGMPCVSVICTTCGYALFFNVFALKVAEALGMKATAESENANG